MRYPTRPALVALEVVLLLLLPGVSVAAVTTGLSEEEALLRSMMPY